MSGSVNEPPLDPDDVVYVASWLGEVVHLTDDCYGLASANRAREVRRKRFPDRPVCKHCNPEVSTMFPPPGPNTRDGRTCRTCGDDLDEDGECPFCVAMDEALGL